MKSVKNYISLVKFSHTIFAMPFALIGYTYAITFSDLEFDVWLLVKILFCMIFARNAAMGFNRYIDRDIDGKNARTADREIPSGKVLKRSAIIFILCNIALFISTTALINALALILSPVAMFVLLGYSYTKRFTSLSHIVLGVALGIAPLGAYIAVTGSLAIVPILLAGLVISWVSGFDIIYSLQDREFDKQNGLYSIPSSFSVKTSLYISLFLHIISAYIAILIAFTYGAGVLYWIGAAIFIALLCLQHIVVRPKNLANIPMAFGTTNGIASIIYAAFVIADLLVKYH